jgi:hypothetical protein
LPAYPSCCRSLLLLAGLILSIICFSIPAYALTYDVSECAGSINLDGRNSEGAWNTAEHHGFGMSDFWFCYDNETLYFYVYVDDESPDGSDWFMVHVDIKGDGGELGNDHYGFRVGRDGERSEFRGGNSRSRSKWDAKVRNRSSDWSLELGIDLEKLGIAPGDTARLRFAMSAHDSESSTEYGPLATVADWDPDTWPYLRPFEGSWGEPENSPPQLSHGSVSSLSGSNIEGNYRFRIRYSDADGDEASEIKVHIGAADYIMQKDGSCDPAIACEYSYTRELSPGNHSFYFSASDGTESARFPENETLWVNVGSINKKPILRISGPAEGTKASGTVRVFGTASDPDGVDDLDYVELRIGAGPWMHATGASNWEKILDIEELYKGQHIIYARAIDKGGMVSDMESVSILVEVQEDPCLTPEQLVAWAMADDDSDGMPNAWELAYGLDPNDASDAALDKDGDGFTNLEEFQGGTNPENPLSYPGAHLDCECEPCEQKGAGVDIGPILIVLILIIIAGAGLIMYQRQMGKGHRPKTIPKVLPLPELPKLPDLPDEQASTETPDAISEKSGSGEEASEEKEKPGEEDYGGEEKVEGEEEKSVLESPIDEIPEGAGDAWMESKKMRLKD